MSRAAKMLKVSIIGFTVANVLLALLFILFCDYIRECVYLPWVLEYRGDAPVPTAAIYALGTLPRIFLGLVLAVDSFFAYKIFRATDVQLGLTYHIMLIGIDIICKAVIVIYYLMLLTHPFSYICSY